MEIGLIFAISSLVGVYGWCSYDLLYGEEHTTVKAGAEVSVIISHEFTNI